VSGAAEGSPGSSIAVAICSDLMFGSRLSAAAARTGTRVEVFGNLDKACGRLESVDAGLAAVRLAIIDLSITNLDPASSVRRLRDANGEVPILAFGPHVHEGRLAAAREAGADEVMSRGAFDAQMDNLLRRYLQPDRP
jgi:DNA-binding NarL/FixJ family response regulator